MDRLESPFKIFGVICIMIFILQIVTNIFPQGIVAVATFGIVGFIIQLIIGWKNFKYLLILFLIVAGLYLLDKWQIVNIV